ncbi:MAG TPA: type II secretion system protein GspH [Gammaproteobacteria bacterium]|nr:type II secretion system protein GspH [Gammaproteobacteria bacterium]
MKMNKANQFGPSRMAGFTLMELMIVLAMAGIIAAIGIPSFSSMITTNQLADITNELTLALKRARAEAIASGRDVIVCSSINSSGCSQAAGNWSKGWVVMVDRNQNGSFLESEPNELFWVKTIDADTSTKIKITPGPFTTPDLPNDFSKEVRFSYTGELKAGTTGGFQICSGVTGSGFPRREITVSVAGQTHFEKNTTATNNC